MVLVAVAMVAIIAMAALSIDVVTLYLAREEAQRSADAAALAAARVISVSGITGTADPGTDTTYWARICGTTGTATKSAQAVAIQNEVGGIAVSTPTVTYSVAGSSSTDCSTLPKAFAVNPLVTVQVTRPGMPTFFSRIWGNRGNSVGATATAEAFNPSESGGSGDPPVAPVQPRCVKPWVVPNRNPFHPRIRAGKYCDQPGGRGPCNPFVDLTDGHINNAGISLGGVGTNGVIGEQFWLVADCAYSGAACTTLESPQANHAVTAPQITVLPNLDYVPGVVGTPASAISASCSGTTAYEHAIEGCDQSSNYQCGAPGNQNAVDLMENPGFSGDTTNGVQCLIAGGNATGQDTLDTTNFPFKIEAGPRSPLAALAGSPGNPISSSNSIVSLPIYDQTTGLNSTGRTPVTFVGFLQVFINSVDQYGNINVTVLNVSGCSKNASGAPALGSSPVPVRLITPP